MSGQIRLATLDRKDWGTPSWLFDRLNDEFGFAVDVCATADNSLCPEFYDRERDALSMIWRGSVFMNPPYGRELRSWMTKATISAAEGATVVALLPARTDVRWFHDYALRGELRFIRGRLRFRGARFSAPFPSLVCVLGPGADPGVGPTIQKPRGADDADDQRAFFSMAPVPGSPIAGMTPSIRPGITLATAIPAHELVAPPETALAAAQERRR